MDHDQRFKVLIQTFFAELLEREGECQLATEGIAVGPDMAEDCNSVILAKCPADFLKRGTARVHSLLPGGVSSSCKISITRAPRLIDSSR